jgi:hypothetical protein
MVRPFAERSWHAGGMTAPESDRYDLPLSTAEADTLRSVVD